MRDDIGDRRVTDRHPKRRKIGEDGGKSTYGESTDSDSDCLSADEDAEQGQRSHTYNVDNRPSTEELREDDFQMMLQRHQVRT